MFVALEGIDAAGKATQARLLAADLKANLFSFPEYGTPVGELIRSNLEGAWTVSQTAGPQKHSQEFLGAMVFQALQLANRMEFAETLHQRRLGHKHVVCDRYWLSGFAYGCADGLDASHLVRLHLYLPQPDLSILLDIDVQQSLERRPERRDRYEKAGGDFLTRVAENYKRVFTHLYLEPGNWGKFVIVDARGSIEQTSALIQSAVQDRSRELSSEQSPP